MAQDHLHAAAACPACQCRELYSSEALKSSREQIAFGAEASHFLEIRNKHFSGCCGLLRVSAVHKAAPAMTEAHEQHVTVQHCTVAAIKISRPPLSSSFQRLDPTINVKDLPELPEIRSA